MLTYFSFTAVLPSCLAIAFKWSKDALHSCSTRVIELLKSSKSTLEALVTAPI